MPSGPDSFKCPGCGTPFSAPDVDFRKNTVTCGSCGRQTPWSSLAGESFLREAPGEPPRHLAVQYSGGRAKLTYRHSVSGSLLNCMGAFLWGLLTLGVIWLAVGPGRDEFALRVFAPVFVVLEAIYLFICLDRLLGKTVLAVEPGRARLFRGMGPAGSTWSFLLPGRSEIVMTPVKDPEFDHCHITVPQPGGKPFQFCGGITDPEVLEYIVSVLRQFRA